MAFDPGKRVSARATFEQRRASIEARVVETLLDAHRLERYRETLLAAEEELHDQRRLTLPLFHARFRSFPVYLVAKPFPKKSMAKLVGMLVPPMQFELPRLYEEGRAEVASGKQYVGLVTDWVHDDSLLMLANIGLGHGSGTRTVFVSQTATYCL